MSLRRRRFDSTPDDDYNPTNYDEKYVIPTNGVAEMQGQSFLSGLTANPLYTEPTYKPEAQAVSSVSVAPTAPPQQSEQAKTAIAEQPMVFALRSDANLYVYEYSDRLEYYRNTPGGMLLCNIENKRR